MLICAQCGLIISPRFSSRRGGLPLMPPWAKRPDLVRVMHDDAYGAFQDVRRPVTRTPHANVKILPGGYVACPGCRRLLTADEYLNENCEPRQVAP
jgi:hypothetical protein